MIPPLPSALRASFARFIGREYGLSFEGARHSALELNVLNATRLSGVTPVALLNAVRAGDPEMRASLIGALTIGETYFCREPVHFAWLKRYLQRSTGPRHLWSAGCASGEEAYSMAITAIEALGSAASRVKITATDLNPAALGRARAGEFRPWSFRCTDSAFRERWFERRGDLLRVRESVRSLVQFSELNLADPSSKGPAGADVAFCRNVLPYFDRQALHTASCMLRTSLGEHGFVITGSADPLLVAPGLVRTLYDGVRCYVPAHQASASPIPSSQTERLLGALARRERFVAPARARIVQPASVQPEPKTPGVSKADSTSVVDDPAKYLKRAQQALDGGDFETVIRDARRALLADPGAAYAHLLIALAALRARQMSLALRSARVGRKALQDLADGAAPIFADGLTRQDLYELFTFIEQFSSTTLLSRPWTAKHKRS